VRLNPAAGRQVRSAMTSEEFRAQYQLGERLTRPPVVTHRAIDESGLPVLVHYLLGSETESASALLREVEAIRTAAEGEIREVTDVDGMPVVVTKVLKEFSTLQDWMSSVPHSAPPLETESEEPGVYTQFFKVSDLATGTEEPRPPSTPQDADAPRLADTLAPTPPSPPEPIAQGEPEGEGGLMREEAPSSPPSEPEAEKAPGAYTMMFGKAGGGGEPEEPDPAKGPGSPAAPPPSTPPPTEGRTAEGASETSEEKKAPGAYTMLFGSGTQADSGFSPTAPPPPPPEPRRSGATLESPPVRPEKPPQEQAAAAVPLPERPVHPQAPGPPPPQGSPPPAGDSQTEEVPVRPPPEVEAAPPSRPVFPRPGSPQSPAPPPPPASVSPGAPPPPPVAEAVPPPPPRQQPPGAEDQPETGGKKSDAPGAYTQIFGRAGTAGPPSGDKPQSWGPPTPAQRPPEPSRPSAGQEHGSPEWQRWKDTPGASGRHIPSDDYLQRLGGEGVPGPTPPSSGGPGVGSLTSGPLPPSGPPLPDGPGHYTMVREGLSTDAVPPGLTKPSAKREPPPPAAAPDFAPSRGSRLLPILGLVVILLIIAAVVTVFALTS